MFKNSYQSGLLSIFYSCGSNPLGIWDTEVQNGHIKRLTDREVNSIVLEIVSTNVATTYITCPKNNKVLGIKLPFLVIIMKNLKRYFSFEITVLDDRNMRRRFRISNFQSTTKIKPFCTSMPIGLSGGWNQIQFNLADFTKRAYGSQFLETLRVQIHANARLRRIYFSDRLYTEEELPQDYKLYLPLDRIQKKSKKEVHGKVSHEHVHRATGAKSSALIAEPKADAVIEPAPTTPADTVPVTPAEPVEPVEETAAEPLAETAETPAESVVAPSDPVSEPPEEVEAAEVPETAEPIPEAAEAAENAPETAEPAE